MEKLQKYCCTDFEKFLEIVDEEIEWGSAALIGREEGNFKPFLFCPYCKAEVDRFESYPPPELIKSKDFTIKWDEKLSFGIPWIDNQHKKLLNQVNVLLSVLISDDHTVNLEKTVQFLKNYVKAHFGTEESIMRKHVYPQHDDHRKMHMEFVKKVDRLSAEFQRKGSTGEMQQIMARELWNWFKQHIVKVDSQFGEYMKTKSAPPDDDTAAKLFDELLSDKN